MAAKKKVVLTDDEKYEKAIKLEESIKCLNYDSYKAEVLKNTIKIYEGLKDYKDSKDRIVKLKGEIKKYEDSAKAYEVTANEEDKKKIKKIEDERNKKLLKNRIKVFICLVILAAAAVCAFSFHKTKKYSYLRAGMYEKSGSYNEAIEIYKRLGDYSDSSEKAIRLMYEYADKLYNEGSYDAARLKFKELGDYDDSAKRKFECELKLIDETEIGESVVYGAYKWRLCEKVNGRAYLIKSEPVNFTPYHNIKKDITWKESGIRFYLNGAFMLDYLSPYEVANIEKTVVEVPDNKVYNTIGGGKTIDKIFLPSNEDAKKYKDILANFQTDFWLINPGESQNKAQFVSMGEVMEEGFRVDDRNIRTRPAMWVKYE